MKGKPQYNVAVENEVLRQHQRVLIDLARYAVEAHDLQRFLDDAVVRVSAALEVSHVKVLRYRPQLGDLVIAAGIGWHLQDMKSISFSTDLASPPGRAYQTGQPVLIEDLAEAKEFRISPFLRAHGILSLLNVPVFAGGAAWGVLEIDSTVLRGFSNDTTTFMVGVAALIGLVIRRVEAQAAQADAIGAAAQEAQKHEMLLREMQHRVKNYFQMLLAMIALHKPQFATKIGQDIAAKFADAIRAMSLAHDQLSSTQTGQVVPLAGYLKALGAGIAVSLEKVAVEVTSDEVDVSIDQAVPIGLIMNELVTNSIKHALDREGGMIHVELTSSPGPGVATLTVRDNGKGIAKNQSRGTGLKLVRKLADQIRGSLEQESSPSGTITRLTFPTRPG